jgi:hypothetical protein
MSLTGLHLLLTYKCTFECDHCFVWGSPWQSGVITLPMLRDIVRQAREAKTVTSIYFEGGEPFLYYSTMSEGMHLVAEAGFKVGVVTNCFWATSEEDALAALRPLAGVLHDMTISTDLFHYNEMVSRQAVHCEAAAKQVGIGVSVISMALPDAGSASSVGQLPPGVGSVMFRGRAAAKLAGAAGQQPWQSLNTCPHERLDAPSRVHVDCLGNLHVCQGISLGSMFQRPLAEICTTYEPQAHPIIGLLLRGGPALLAQEYGVAVHATYADACHLCYETRVALRSRFPNILAPDQMYGVAG